MRSKKLKFLCVLLSICMGLQFMACSSSELEESCFPMVVTAGYDDGKVIYWMGFPRVGSSGEEEPQVNEIQVSAVKKKNFEEAKAEYEKHLNRQVDYNHLKVLVLEEDLLENQTAYNEMLTVLGASEDFPRNTYVCAVDDLDDLIAIEKNLPQDLGSYLEEYLKNHEAQKERMLTLGDLIDEKENQTMNLYMPYLDVEENYVDWKGYVNNYGKIWQDSY